jgi:type VI secretion system protein ImpB
MSESIQKKKLRIRPARVNMTYEVETNGAIRLKELPFVIGVMADLAGQSKKVPNLRERGFEAIDRDNFDQKMKEIAPRATMKVDNKLKNDGTQLAVDIEMQQLDDFGPDAIVQNVKPLKDLMEVRRQLAELLTRSDGNDRAEEVLDAILKDKDVRAKLKDALGTEPEASEPGA